MSKIRRAAVSTFLLVLAAAAPGAALGQRMIRAIPYDTALGMGPYKVTPSTDPRLPGHTIYAPPKLDVLGGARLPIVAWGEGGCIDNGTRFRWFLSEIASHGYLVLATGKMGSLEEQVWQPPKPSQAQPAAAPSPRTFPPAATHPSQLIEAIDWAIAENGRRDSPFYNRLDTSKVAVMGMSCGGIQAIEAGADPRVTTTVVWNSGLFPDASGLNASAGGKALTKADLDRLHGSVAYVSGDETDIAFKNANDDFAYLTRIPAFRAYRKGTPHDGTYGEVAGGEFAQVGLAWLDWRLKGNPEASRLFVGSDCGLCRNPQWMVSKKNHP